MKNGKRILSVGIVLALVVFIICVIYFNFTSNLSNDESLTTISNNIGKLQLSFAGNSNINLSDYDKKNNVLAKEFSVIGTNLNAEQLKYQLVLVIDTNKYESVSYLLNGYKSDDEGVKVNNIELTSIGSNNIVLGEGYFVNANKSVHLYKIEFRFNNNVKIDNNSFKAHIEIKSI